MAQREVTLKILVNDREVVGAEKSLHRLEAATNKVGASSNRFEEFARKIKSSLGEGGVRGAINSFQKDGSEISKKYVAELQKLLPVSDAAVGGLSRVSAAAGPVGIALAAVAVSVGVVIYAFVQLAEKILEVTQAYAKYAVETGKMAEETGLAVETVAALRLQAERTGTSFDKINAPIANFRKTIGQAAAGSDEARAKLQILGIDATKAIYDIDGAFRQAISTIVKLPAGLDQSRALFAAFGDEGYKLLPFLQSFNGDVDKAIRKAEELGLTLSGKDVQAAKEFQKATVDLDRAVQGLTNLIGREFMPTVTAVIRDFTTWLSSNRATIRDWGETAGNVFRGVVNGLREIVEFIDDHPVLWRLLQINAATVISQNPILAGAITIGSAAEQSGRTGSAPSGALPPQYNVDYSRPRVDPAALEAMRAAAEKLRQEREKEAKAELSAQIKLFENHIRSTEKVYDDQFKQITEKFKETGNVSQYEAKFEALRQWYGGVINELAGDWSTLVERQTLAEKEGQNQRYLAWKETQDKLQALGQKTLDFEDAKNKAIAEHNKKASGEYLKDLEAEMNRAIELREQRNQTNIAQVTRDHATTLLSERQMIDQINKFELDSLNFRKAQLEKYLAEVTGNADKEAEVKHKIRVLDEQIAQQQIKNADRVLDAEERKQKKLEDLRKQYEEYKQSLEDELDAALRNNRELTIYERTLRDIERGVAGTTEAERERLLVIAAQADAVNELNRQHAELKDFFSETLSYAFEGDFEGLVESFRRRARESLVEGISEWLATNILGFDPGQTDNPVAKPIVGKIDQTNRILSNILGVMTGNPIASGAGGLGGIFNFGGSGIGPGGTPFFNPGGSGGGLGGAGGGLPAGILGLLQGQSAPAGSSDAYGMALSEARRAATVFPNLLQTAGSFVPGRVGKALSYAGIGMQIGMIFGPVGSIIGTAAGFLLGLFGGDPKRKRDKNEKIPALNKGFTDAIAELRRILSDSQSLRYSDPQEAVTRAEEVRAQIASGFGLQFESKKYRRQAQTLIATRLREADAIIEQIKNSAAIAAGAADRRQRILPEFAGGYFADFFRPNGLLPGMFDGRDNILAMISRGEMVLNPRQQHTVKALAGFDVFAGAGIPNYPNPSPSAQLAIGGMAGTGLGISPNVIVEPKFTLIAEGVVFTDETKVWMRSDDGRRTLVKVIKEEKQKDRTL